MRAGWRARTGPASSAYLGEAKSLHELGEGFGADLTAAEVRYLIEREWALDADDICGGAPSSD
jgi:glycerol-3-phosphate dehydrogenase